MLAVLFEGSFRAMSLSPKVDCAPRVRRELSYNSCPVGIDPVDPTSGVLNPDTVARVLSAG